MKKRITSLMLILVVAVSMTMGASATSYIPDDVTYQNLNGQQLAIKTYTPVEPFEAFPKEFHRIRIPPTCMKTTSSMTDSCIP